MKQQKLNFRFHNPNTAEDTSDYILKLLLEANREKLEQILRESNAGQAQQRGRET